MSEVISTVAVEYREVLGFPGYRVGDDGTVWSCWRNGGDNRTGQVLTKTWHRLKGWVDKRRGQSTGYIKIGLMRSGKLFRLRLHRIVLDAFVGPCPEGLECRHLDDDKTNNRLSNLVWGTPSQNTYDAYANGIMPKGENHHKATLTAVDIPAIRIMLGAGLSRRKIASKFGVSKGTIDAIHNGRTWKVVSNVG